MQQIIPFQSTEEALTALDNGGRFYNLFTKADDGIITAPELSKVAGLYAGKQQMSVFLAMSIADMSAVAREQVVYSLSPALKEAFEKYCPAFLTPAQATATAQISSGAIISGKVKRVGSNTDFKGFIMVPIFAGKVMTFSMVPIIDSYDVYELHDEQSSDTFFIAHARGQQHLPETRLRVGGIIKELRTGKSETAGYTRFLETLYYQSNKQFPILLK
jgi:hypothetical protein